MDLPSPHLPVPLVSCIMPTANRRRFVLHAVRDFLRQDYPNKELVILDDGADSVADLLPDDPQIRYIRQSGKRTLGRKRNECVQAARGDLILHWDDDDWHAPHRIRYQVESLLAADKAVCGINTLLFYDPAHERAYRYVYPPNERLWLSGSTLCYTRDYWKAHPFPEVNVGEDARFVWAGDPAQMLVLPDYQFHVGFIHDANTSPKHTNAARWSAYPVEQIHALMQADRELNVPAPPPLVREPSRSGTLRNVFACLVHERPECVLDLVRNLHHLDPTSTILLYNGGENADLLAGHRFKGLNAVAYPAPKRQKWGQLHHFALDAMAFALDNFAFDTLTIVDSDQLALRAGYSDFIGRMLPSLDGIGLLGSAPERQPPSTRIPPAMTAFAEHRLWQPFLRRFPNGEAQFVHWTFWPSTVFTHDAARDLLQLWKTDEELQRILGQSKLWATEEVLFPTLIKLLGYEYAANPCSYEYVKYRQPYTTAQLETALRCENAYWMHPVERQLDHPLRRTVRQRFRHYSSVHLQEATRMNSGLLLTLPILKQMRAVEGWLEEDEADLLIAACTKALHQHDAPHAIVEVGSYCGRSTVVLGSVVKTLAPASRVYAIDPHDGKVGAEDQRMHLSSPTLRKFTQNMANAGVADVIEIICQHSYEVEWNRPIHLLLVDGLHDYLNVSRDYHHFERCLVPGALVAFHDYADYYPGVQAFVDGLVASGKVELCGRARTMVVVRVLPTAVTKS